jgi:predicted alpha/beta hydrolase family esterase
MVDSGMSGHINTDSRLGDWPEGRALLEELLKEKNGH